MIYGKSEYLLDSEILKQHKDILAKMVVDRIFYIGYRVHENEYYIRECCDECYEHTLTKDECVELSNIFKELSEQM